MIDVNQLQYPNIQTTLETLDNNKFKISINPLLPGFGHTLGNSIRRVMLSSVPGFSVVTIRINDVTHEYQGVEGVVEDVLNVVLNLKKLRVKINSSEEKATLKINVKKEGDITANMFKSESDVIVLNPDLYICHLSKDLDLNIEVDIKKGVGYLAADQIDFGSNLDPHNLLVDALFSPVRNVALNVDKVRVGDQTNFDKLDITFDTDGSISGEDLASYCFGILAQLYQQMNSSLTSGTVAPVTKKKASSLDLPEDLVAILEKNEVTTMDQLEDKRDELNDFAGITSKHIKQIEKLLDA